MRLLMIIPEFIKLPGKLPLVELQQGIRTDAVAQARCAVFKTGNFQQTGLLVMETDV